jgi:hypothetical protein
MSGICPVTFLNLEHLIDRDGLREDMECQTFIPFSSSYAKQGFFKHAPFWEQAKVNNLPEHEVPFVTKINRLINASPRFYKQHANHNVPLHKDIDTLCCVNILITKDNAPVHFEEWGDYTYHCALLDVTHKHRVDLWPKERHLLKLSIFDRTYKQMREELKDYISQHQGFVQK